MNPSNGPFRSGPPPFRGGRGQPEPFRGRRGMMPPNHRGGMMMGRGFSPRGPPGGRGRFGTNGRGTAQPPLRRAMPPMSRRMSGPCGRGGPPPPNRTPMQNFRGGIPRGPFGHNLPPPPPPLPRRDGGFGPTVGSNILPMAAPPHPLPPKPPAYTKAQLDASWTEHTAPDGTKYYYNSLSRESTFTRPVTFTVTPSVILPTASNAATRTAGPVSAVWKEYTDVASGKTYYSNGVTTQWTRPVELGELPEFAADAVPKEESLHDTVSRKKRKREEEEVHYESKEQAAVAFNEFLVSKDVATSLKWSEVTKMFSGHGQWEAIGKHLSTGERRQALAEYQTKRQNELKNLERQERQKAKDDFTRMLTEVLPTIEVFSDWNSNWSDVRQLLSQDDRFKSVKDEGTRETLFVDFCEEFRKREDRRRRVVKRDAEVAFVSFLKDRRKAGRLPLLGTFHEFQASLSHAEQEAQNLEFLEHLEESDQRRLYTDFITEEAVAEEEQKRRTAVASQRGVFRRVEAESSDEEGEIVCAASQGRRK